MNHVLPLLALQLPDRHPLPVLLGVAVTPAEIEALLSHLTLKK